MEEHDRWLEVPQVAKRLGRSGQTVRNLIRSGHLRAMRLRDGSHWQVRESVVNAFLRDREHIAHKAPSAHV
jgi:excisionase family DNA binding protein